MMSAMSKRILIALTSHGRLGDTGRSTGFYVSEAAEPWAAFREAGHEVDLVSTEGGKPPEDGFDPGSDVQQRFLDEMADALTATPAPTEVDPKRYDVIFFAGGHGAMWDFPADAGLQHLARSIYEDGGVVAAVCHGPAALTELTLSDGSYLVDGREVAAFSNDEEGAVGLTKVVPFLLADRLIERGAHHTARGKFKPHVVRDGRLLTGQNPASSTGVAHEILAALSQ